MEVSDGSDQGKAESGSWRASAALESIKALEDVRAFAFGNTRPGVGHLCDWPPVAAREGQANRRSTWRMAKAVFDQIDEELGEQFMISAHPNI
jgi:hypothetical protein